MHRGGLDRGTRCVTASRLRHKFSECLVGGGPVPRRTAAALLEPQHQRASRGLVATGTPWDSMRHVAQHHDGITSFWSKRGAWSRWGVGRRHRNVESLVGTAAFEDDYCRSKQAVDVAMPWRRMCKSRVCVDKCLLRHSPIGNCTSEVSGIAGRQHRDECFQAPLHRRF